MPGLNPAQQAAVEHGQGPMLVLAGAGSGKTRVITERIARLVENGTRPDSILAVSFTNKAAAEMNDRMIPLIGRTSADELWLSTFHSFGVKFLNVENRALGFDGKFVIFDQGDALGLVREIMLREGLGDRSVDIMALLSRISLWKNAFLMPDQIPESDFEYDAIARDIYPFYEEALSNMHAVDFDDLVVAPVRILKSRDDIRQKWSNRFRYLLIDEFQDTNRSQLALVKLLTNDLRNVTVVGDDDQSIYSWRGADVGNILDFERHYPGCKIVKLEENYRSKAPILSVANAVIAQSRGTRHEKTLRAARGTGELVKVVTPQDDEQEAKFIVKQMRAHANERKQYRDMAVLYRSNQQGRVVEEHLQMSGIPYRIFGGTKFYDRKEVKDAIAYLRLVVHPRDELSMRRVINFPPRGIGDTSVKRITAYALTHNMTFMRAIKNAHKIEIPARAQAGCQKLVEALAKAREGYKSQHSITETTRQLLKDVGFVTLLKDDDSKQGQKRRDNLAFFVKSVKKYEHAPSDTKPSIDQFLTRLTLRAEGEEAAVGNQVTLSSLHSAKGLEFDIVFLIGCVEGQLPHSRTTDPKITEAAPSDVDEERRLFYVGVTRARDVLYITRPQRKNTRGRVFPQVPSRFLQGFPDDAWEPYDAPPEVGMDSREMASLAEDLLRRLAGKSTETDSL